MSIYRSYADPGDNQKYRYYGSQQYDSYKYDSENSYDSSKLSYYSPKIYDSKRSYDTVKSYETSKEYDKSYDTYRTSAKPYDRSYDKSYNDDSYDKNYDGYDKNYDSSYDKKYVNKSYEIRPKQGTQQNPSDVISSLKKPLSPARTRMNIVDNPQGGEAPNTGGQLGLLSSPSKRLCSALILIFIVLVIIFIIVASVILYFNYVSVLSSPTGTQRNDKSGLTDQPHKEDEACKGVICPYGSCTQGKCNCPRGCRTNNTVCGNDGISYASLCHLKRHACTSVKHDLTIAFSGPCETSRDPCETMSCPKGSLCVSDGTAKSVPECRCLASCPGSPDASPVCGTDGSDYPSACELYRTGCQLKRDMEVAFNGMCDPCRHYVCEDGEVCLVDENRVPKCQCNSSCPSHLSLVCASDGITYINECAMNFEGCRTRKLLSVISRGDCESGSNPCAAVTCNFGQQCFVNQFEVATCQCNTWCPPVVTPVCASDGVTYNSLCHLHRQSCMVQQSIQLAYVGACGSGGPCSEHSCSFGATCVERYGQAECQCDKCKGEYEPLCANDNRTFHSRCLLRREICLTKDKSLQIKHMGPCDACIGVDCGQFGICETDIEGLARCKCFSNCSHVPVSHVCGTDGKTYSKECDMGFAACDHGYPIKIAYKGKCDMCEDVQCKYGARCEKGACICPTNCPIQKEPICGSDKITYNNECVMRKASCERKEPVTSSHFGTCEDIGLIVTDVIYPTPIPPSDLLDPCLSVVCISGGNCQSDSKGKAKCVCDMYCSPPQIYEPVCGSDKQFYESACLMNLHACNLQIELFLRPVEECAAEATGEKPCNGSAPLVNPATGKFINCGKGGAICPPGTYCHETKYFTRCCRDHSYKIDVIEAPEPDACGGSNWGCCGDDLNFATGPDREGCPEMCQCHNLGAVQETCSLVTGSCVCRPGVGGDKCEHCLPGYFGIYRISRGAIGCTPCGCSRFGSLKPDCKQMTGKCVCKPGVSGHRCTECPRGQVLGPSGCQPDRSLSPVGITCKLLQCHFGGHCQEEDGIAICKCPRICLPVTVAMGVPVCGSDGVTYSSECELKSEACEQQKDIVLIDFGTCAESRPLAKTVRRSTRTNGWKFRTPYLIGQFHAKKPNTSNIVGSDPLVTSLFSRKEFSLDITESDNPAFGGNSYIQLENLKKPITNLTMEIEFTIYEENGIVIHIQEPVPHGEELMGLRLIRGFLELRVRDHQNGVQHLQSQEKMELNAKHSVGISVKDEEMSIKVNRQVWTTRSNFSTEPLTMASGGNLFYIGGIPETSKAELSDSNPSRGAAPWIPEGWVASSHWSKRTEEFYQNFRRGLVGCLHLLKIEEKIDLKSNSPLIIQRENVENCGSNPCYLNMCRNGGICNPKPREINALKMRDDESINYFCTCQPPYTGRSCESTIDICQPNICSANSVCNPFFVSKPCLKVSDAFGDWGIPDFQKTSYAQIFTSLERISDLVAMEIRFLPRSSKGIILYCECSNSTQFVSLTLIGRKIQLAFNDGREFTNFSSKYEVSLNRWHSVVFSRRNESYSLTIDNYTTTRDGASVVLSPESAAKAGAPTLFVGGISLPNSKTASIGSALGFDGAIQFLKVNLDSYQNILTSASIVKNVQIYVGLPCFPNPCFNGGLCLPLLSTFVCRCFPNFVGPFCETIPQMDTEITDLGDLTLDQPVYLDGTFPIQYNGQVIKYHNGSKPNYLTSNPLDYEMETSAGNNTRSIVRLFSLVHQVAEVSFKTSVPNGLLLWAGYGSAWNEATDVMTLSIENGRPQLTFSLGGESVSLRSQQLVSDDEWHVVRIIRRKRTLILKVDKLSPSKGKFRRRHTISTRAFSDATLWLGGIWQLQRPLGVSFENFIGCLDKVAINGRIVHLIHQAATPYFKLCYVKGKRKDKIITK